MYEEINALVTGLVLADYRSSHARIEGHRYILSSLTDYLVNKKIGYTMFHSVEVDAYERKKRLFFDLSIERDGVKYLIEIYSNNRARAFDDVLQKLAAANAQQYIPILVTWVKRPAKDIPEYVRLINVGLGEEEQVDFLEKVAIIPDNLKKVSIYSVGSCDPTTRVGRYHAMLEFGEKRKYLTKDLSNTTVNRCIIQGLIDCVDLLKTPCAVELITATLIGANTIKRGKGVNHDLLSILVEKLNGKDCTMSFNAREGEGDTLSTYIKRFSTA